MSNEGPHQIECPRCRLTQWIDLAVMHCDNCGLDLIRPRETDLPYRYFSTLEVVAIVTVAISLPLGVALLYAYH